MIPRSPVAPQTIVRLMQAASEKLRRMLSSQPLDAADRASLARHLRVLIDGLSGTYNLVCRPQAGEGTKALDQGTGYDC